MDRFYLVPEIQINDGEISCITPVVCLTKEQAQGTMYSKMGAAFSNPRDYTMCAIIDHLGQNIERNAYDMRSEKTPIYAAIVLHTADGENIEFDAVSAYEGDSAEKSAMYEYHSKMTDAWDNNHMYDLGVVLEIDGYNKTFDVHGKLPERVEPEE